MQRKLGKSINDPITPEEMKRLRRFEAENRDIHDLTGLQFATNLTELFLRDNRISDLSPIAGLIKLQRLWLDRNPTSDISPLQGLKNLTELWVRSTRDSDLSAVSGLINLLILRCADSGVSDLSPIARLINLRELDVGDDDLSDLSPLAGLTKLKLLDFSGSSVSDLSPLAGLINLEHFSFNVNNVSNLSPLAGLINLKRIHSWGNPFSDLSPLAGLTKLEVLDICGARLQEASLAPLIGLTGLKELYLAGNGISDISPIARLTGLERLSIHGNHVSNISAIAGLTNLKWLGVDHNNISDFSPLNRLRANTKIDWHNNPGFPKGGPKIEGPWLWAFILDVRLDSGVDLLAQASGGEVTEVEVSTRGATLGKSVGAEEWISDKLPPTGRNNLDDMLKRTLPNGVIYGTVSLYSPREQQTTMYVGGEHGLKVWLNGALIHKDFRRLRNNDYSNFFPVTLQQGKNVLLVAVATRFRTNDNNAFFGFESGAEYTLGTGIGYTFSKMPIHLGDTFTFDVRAENVSNLAGWQFDIAFDPSVLEAVDVSEGDFLKSDGGATFFQSGRIDNAAGKITGLIAGRISDGGVSGSGSVVQVRFKAKTEGETTVALQNFLFGSAAEESIPAAPLEISFTVEERLLTGDVNRDGVVNILDLIRVAQQLGKRVSADSPVDVNGDGVVNIFDLTLVARGIGGAAAPCRCDMIVDFATTIEAWIERRRAWQMTVRLFFNRELQISKTC